jgi:hypothetical protein
MLGPLLDRGQEGGVGITQAGAWKAVAHQHVTAIGLGRQQGPAVGESSPVTHALTHLRIGGAYRCRVTAPGAGVWGGHPTRWRPSESLM